MSCLFHANPNPNPALCPGFAFECPAVERDYMGIGLCVKEEVVEAKAPRCNVKNLEVIAHVPTLDADDLCGSHLKLAPPSSSADDGGDGDADDGEPFSNGNIGWPPISSYRKVTTRSLLTKPPCNSRGLVQFVVPQAPILSDNTNNNDHEASGNDASSGVMVSTKPRKPLHIKISMDGTPIMRKLDLESLQGYQHLSLELHKLFKFYKRNLSCEVGVQSSFKDAKDVNFILTYKDTDGDWMLVGDTPWETFARTARRIRIMKKVK